MHGKVGELFFSPLFPLPSSAKMLFSPLHVGRGHVTCIGQWNVSQCETSLKGAGGTWVGSCIPVIDRKTNVPQVQESVELPGTEHFSLFQEAEINSRVHPSP